MNEKFAYRYAVEQLEDVELWLDLAKDALRNLLGEHKYANFIVPSYIQEIDLRVRQAARDLEFVKPRYERWADEKESQENG